MLRKTVSLTIAIIVGFTGQVMAGFNTWTSEVESDPFSGGSKVTVDFASSIRSGVLIMCDTARDGMLIRAVPGFVFSDHLKGFEPILEFAIDGKRLFGQQGMTGAVGDNLAVAQVQLTHDNAEALANAFTKAKKQIAIKDGISDRPFLLRATGSSKAGALLTKCLEKQSSTGAKSGANGSVSDADLMTDAGKFVQFRAMVLAAQDKCPDYRFRPAALEPKGIDLAELADAADLADGARSEAEKKFMGQNCPAVLREPLRYTALSFDQVWVKK